MRESAENSRKREKVELKIKKFATANPSVGGEEVKTAVAAMFDVRGLRFDVKAIHLRRGYSECLRERRWLVFDFIETSNHGLDSFRKILRARYSLISLCRGTG
jgi:hypothetical protein